MLAMTDAEHRDGGAARVVVTHWVHPEVSAYLAGFCRPVLPSREQGVWPRGTMAELARDAVAIIACMADHIDEEFLSGCPDLRVVSGTVKGYDNFDARACARHGVWLTILPDMLTVPTAELAVCLTLGIMRHVGEADRSVRADGYAGWRPWFYGSSLQQSTVGILGMGRVGRAFAARIRPFGAHVVCHDSQPLPDKPGDPAVSWLPFGRLLAASDVVLVALPLTAQTRHLIDAQALAAMRPGAFLVNIGRGSVVDEEAVADSLGSGRLAGYAADVFAMEDWALPGHPDRIPDRLLEHPRTLFTPHLGSAVDSVRREMSIEASRQVRQVLSGQRPDHAVNEPRLSGLPGTTRTAGRHGAVVR